MELQDTCNESHLLVVVLCSVCSFESKWQQASCQQEYIYVCRQEIAKFQSTMHAKIENEMWTGKIFFGRFVMTSNLSVWQWWIYNREYTKAGHKLYLELCFEDGKARQRVMNFCVHCYVKENTTLSCFEVPTATPLLMLAGTRWDGTPYHVTLGQPKTWQPFAVGSLVLSNLILTQWINALRRLLLTSRAKTLPFNSRSGRRTVHTYNHNSHQMFRTRNHAGSNKNGVREVVGGSLQTTLEHLQVALAVEPRPFFLVKQPQLPICFGPFIGVKTP